MNQKISRIQQCTWVIGWPCGRSYWWCLMDIIFPLVYGLQSCYTLSTVWRNIKAQCSIFFSMTLLELAARNLNISVFICLFFKVLALSIFYIALTFLSQAILWLTKPQGCFWWVFGVTSLLMEVKVSFIIACSLEMSRLHILFFAKVVLGWLSEAPM